MRHTNELYQKIRDLSNNRSLSASEFHQGLLDAGVDIELASFISAMPFYLRLGFLNPLLFEMKDIYSISITDLYDMIQKQVGFIKVVHQGKVFPLTGVQDYGDGSIGIDFKTHVRLTDDDDLYVTASAVIIEAVRENEEEGEPPIHYSLRLIIDTPSV